jgi:hypothetical protein
MLSSSSAQWMATRPGRLGASRAQQAVATTFSSTRINCKEIDRDRNAGLTIGSKVKTTPEHVLRAVVAQLPKGWHVTLLPSHVIMYKNDKRKFPSGRLIGKSPGPR